MSYMKRQWEEENPDLDPLRCIICGIQATPELKGRRLDDDKWACHEHIDVEAIRAAEQEAAA